jgi:hypothetical protein
MFRIACMVSRISHFFQRTDDTIVALILFSLSLLLNLINASFDNGSRKYFAFVFHT